MSYSSALFASPEEALEDAQRRKYRRLLGLLQAEPGQHILEIGCGWGGFCEEAARAGYRVTGITLSREQLEYAQRRIRAAGLSERVELRLQDYRDVTEQYDHIVSIEMFEAVGEAYWPTYFTTLRERLRPGGRAALQVITIDDQLFPRYRRQADFIQLHIFPGGMLPSPGVFREQLRRAGLRAASTDFFGSDYAETLRRWHQQFRDRRFEVRDAGFDDEFLRTWRYYLAYCEAGFRTGRIDLMQTLIERA
jgi:cyclopropane-fatty-acyl-phospholipid synthase